MGTSAGFSDLFRNRFIRAILLSGLFLQLGIWVRNLSILYFVMEMTNGDEIAVAAISVAEFAPIFLFSLIGGAFADRWRPKKTMIWCDILSALSVFAVFITLLFSTWQVVFVVTLISAILSQFSQPAGMKLFKLHVPEAQMQMGMSLYQTLFAVFMILGPVVGTLIYEQFGISVAIAITGVMFLLSAFALTFLPADRIENDEERVTTIWQELGLGIKYVARNKFLSILGANFLAAGLAIGIIHPLGIFIITEQLGLDKSYLQWFTAVNGIAMIVGGGLALGLSKKISPIRMLAIGMAVDTVAFSVMGFSSMLWLTLVVQFLSGLMMPAIQISINTMILQNTEEAFVGRVNGIMTPLFMGAMVVMMSVAGFLKKGLGLTTTYQLSAMLFVVGIVLVIPLLIKPEYNKIAGAPAKELAE